MSTTPDQKETPVRASAGGSQNEHGINGPESTGTPSAVKLPIPFQVFGSRNVGMGRVYRLPPTSFEKFVRSLPIQRILIARDEFHRLTDVDQKLKKRVDYFCAATFKSDSCTRKTENAVAVALLVLDVDDNNDAKGLRTAPQLVRDRLRNWNFFAYETASSTMQKPRCRICVQAAGFDVRHYKDAVQAVAKCLGLSEVTTESKVVVQPMYLSSVFLGENSAIKHPVFASRVDGVPFQLADLSTSDSVDVNNSSGPVPGDVDPAMMPIGEIENLPAGEFPVEHWREIAKYLDPGCKRSDWITVAAGLKNQYGEDGYSLWDEWSASSASKYPGPSETRKQWNSLQAAPTGRRAVKIGTVIKMAKQAGWRPRDHSWPQFRRLVEQCARSDQRGDAQLFAYLVKDQFLHNHTSKKWMLYSNGVWVPDEIRAVRAKVKPIIAGEYTTLSKTLSAELAADVDPGKLDAAGGSKDPRRKLQQLLLQREAQLNRRKHQDDVLHLAGDFLPVVADSFDTEQNLLNLLDGTLDLRTKHFRRHSPSDLLRKQMLVEFKPAAKCPRFWAFLDQVFLGDLELIAFVLRLLGYSLTGRVDHDFIVFCYGAGGNGKSTLLDLLRTLLGDYFVHLPMESLLTQARGQRDSHASAELVRLHGARFAVASEIPEGRKLNESLVKDLSGGGVYTARELYAQPFTFTLTHKLWLVGNHKPEIHGQDDGIWRRIHMVPFEHQFPKSGEPGYRDRTEVMKELQEESSGILNLLLAGLHDLERNGLNPPAVVKAATDTYRVDSDPLGDFIDARCVTNPSFSCPSRDLWDAYSAYSRGDRGAYNSQRALTTALERRGYSPRRTNSRRLIEGITLIEDVI